MRPEELEYIRTRLGREPTEAELAVFESHWSEHCSYKSTRRLLKTLPSRAPWVVRGPGADAPLVRIGGGLLVAFKIESHNHPSAIDPYNGAATGVGGIIRDILTIGARPIGLLVNLHFGPLEDSHARWIARGVVRGISDYGNRVGVPVVGGETWFDESFARNPIVLATCVGVVREGDVPSEAVEPGDYIVVAGSPADKSGLGGSAFASRGLAEGGGGADLGAVQVADPLMGKLLIDLVQEARRCAKLIKDLGGGGLATALAELAEWTGLGVEARLDAVHLADLSMGPGEVLASETQERMIFVVGEDGLRCLGELADKYEVPYSVVGRFSQRPGLRAYWRGELVIDLPNGLLRAPEVEWSTAEARRAEPFNPPEIPLAETIEKVLSSPNVASKEAIYSQFDSTVGARTVLRPGEADAAVLKVFEAGALGVAVKGDANPRYSYLDPYWGAANAFVKAYRNVAVVGARPLAAVDSINVGSPERPDRYWQFAESVRGLAKAAEELGVPIVGGKVSLYNEMEGGDEAIKPVVAVVVLGVIDDVGRARRAVVKDGDVVRLLGVTKAELGGSEYLWRIFGRTAGRPPAVDFAWERKLAEALAALPAPRAHDVGVGGLAVALAKMAVNGGVGISADLCKAPAEAKGIDVIAYSESNGRVLLAAEPDVSTPGVTIGEAGGGSFELKCGGATLYKADVERIKGLMGLDI